MSDLVLCPPRVEDNKNINLTNNNNNINIRNNNVMSRHYELSDKRLNTYNAYFDICYSLIYEGKLFDDIFLNIDDNKNKKATNIKEYISLIHNRIQLFSFNLLKLSIQSIHIKPFFFFNLHSKSMHSPDGYISLNLVSIDPTDTNDMVFGCDDLLLLCDAPLTHPSELLVRQHSPAILIDFICDNNNNNDNTQSVILKILLPDNNNLNIIKNIKNINNIIDNNGMCFCVYRICPLHNTILINEYNSNINDDESALRVLHCVAGVHGHFPNKNIENLEENRNIQKEILSKLKPSANYPREGIVRAITNATTDTPTPTHTHTHTRTQEQFQI
eukprot:GHVR01170576.1.p2 GENE.GHVR01170576.1~~GHVR01170576.1.p2  ORF type:complete len:330 (+),score=121.16 GHVR01170576.1:70-1059(+)